MAGASNLQNRRTADRFFPPWAQADNLQAYTPLSLLGINTITATLLANTAQVNAVAHSLGVTPGHESRRSLHVRSAGGHHKYTAPPDYLLVGSGFARRLRCPLDLQRVLLGFVVLLFHQLASAEHLSHLKPLTVEDDVQAVGELHHVAWAGDGAVECGGRTLLRHSSPPTFQAWPSSWVSPNGAHGGRRQGSFEAHCAQPSWPGWIRADCVS